MTNFNIFLKWSIISLLLMFLFFWCIETKQCIPRYFEQESCVCVCNATYCDTVPPVRLPSVGMFIKYTSSRCGLRFAKSIGNFTSNAKANFSEIVLEVNSSRTQQKIYGWGGAFTDSAGYNINSLNKTVRRRLLRSYFSKTGIEYSLCRVQMGSSDFSTRFYTYNDMEDDVNLTNFKLTVEDYKYKIPFIKRAMNMTNNKLKLLLSGWISPLWMKTTKKPASGLLKKEYYQTWTDYHLKFLEAYDKMGIKFWGITTGNEPSNFLIPVLNITNVGWLPWDQGKWIAENFGPTLRKSKFKNIKIIGVDDQTILTLGWLVLETLFSSAESYIDGIGVHWYFNNIFPSPLPLTHLLFPDIFVLNTEACSGDMRYPVRVALGSWERGEKYAEDIIKDMNEWVTGWIEWNLALDTNGGPTYVKNNVDATIIVNATSQEFYKQPTFYFLGHFSKFVPPDSVKIFSSVNSAFIKAVAYLRPDKATTIVVLNKNDETLPLTIHDPRRGYIQFNATKRSISTLVYS